MYLGDPGCSIDTLFRHLDHMVDVAGIDDVGLGLDVVFNGKALDSFFNSRPDEWPFTQDPNRTGAETMVPEELLLLVDAVLDRGYTGSDIAKIPGEHFDRVFKAHWSEQ